MRRSVVFVGLAMSSATIFAADIDLGDGDSIAVDQPRMVFTFTIPGTDDEVGPNLGNNLGLLDTGANGLLISAQAYDQSLSDPHLPYAPALNSSGQYVVYFESGVSGYEPLTVYQTYDMQFAGYVAGAPVQLAQNVNIFGTPFKDLGVPAVIGMPAMAGRVVQIDPKPITKDLLDPSWDLTQTQFYTAPPVSKTPVSYHINLPMLPYEHSGVDPDHPNDPRPTFADLPLIDLTTTTNNIPVNQRLLLDTGAQTSIISLESALAMGINMTDFEDGGDIMDYLAVGGIGGEVSLPMVYIDLLTVPTNEGDNLLVSNTLVGVLDIVGIDGVLGMDFLTNGYAATMFGGTGEYGAFSEITLDFRNSDMGVLRLDMNPAYVIPEPTGLALLGVFSILIGRRRSC